MQPAQQLKFIRGFGISSDANARADSLRQVLLAGAEVYEALKMPPGALRENILLEGDIAELRSGQLLRVGNAVLRLTIPCEVCKKLNEVRPGLPRELQGQRGLLARVVASGEIALHNLALILPVPLDAIPSDPRARIYDLLCKVPSGRVVATMAAIAVLGLVKGYVRVLPRVLKAAPVGIPVHRMVTAQHSLLAKHLPDQMERLQAEGVRFERGRVRTSFVWDAVNYFGVEPTLT